MSFVHVSRIVDDMFWAGAILGAISRNLNDYSVVTPPKTKTYDDFAADMEREYLTTVDTLVTGPSIIIPRKKKKKRL